MRLPITVLRTLGPMLAIASLAVLSNGRAAIADTLIKETGVLSINDARLEDGSLYDAYTFSGDRGQQVTVILESREFDPYLILVAPNGERINENDDISRRNLNARLVVVLPAAGTYTVYANSYDVGKSGRYDITVRTNDQSAFPENIATMLLNPSAQCSTALSNAVSQVEANRDASVFLSVLQLLDRYESIPEARPDGIEMSLTGTATPSIIASSEFLRQVATSLIRDCTSVGVVAFEAEGDSEETIFGYSSDSVSASADGFAVNEFTCSADLTVVSSEQLPPWGKKLCL